MRILFIRHGDPDYDHNCLTAKGVEEASALSAIIRSLHVGDCFVSPLGRARQTAQIALAGTGIEPVELDWIQEFMTEYDINGSEELQEAFPNTRTWENAREYNPETYTSIGMQVNPELRKSIFRSIPVRNMTSARDADDASPDLSSASGGGVSSLDLSSARSSEDSDSDSPIAGGTSSKPRTYVPRVPWDIIPRYYTQHPELSNPATWRTSMLAENGGKMPDGTSTLLACYDYVTKQFDTMLTQYGYHRTEGGLYRTERGIEKTITFFCHFGITAVLLSHLWNTSPFLLLQSLCTLPTSVTEVVTEEREEGYAYFRALRIGDTTHLALAGQRPSFAARFCETYHNKEQRH